RSYTETRRAWKGKPPTREPPVDVFAKWISSQRVPRRALRPSGAVRAPPAAGLSGPASARAASSSAAAGRGTPEGRDLLEVGGEIRLALGRSGKIGPHGQDLTAELIGHPDACRGPVLLLSITPTTGPSIGRPPPSLAG